MHAGDGECTAQHFTGQAINDACRGRSKREQFLGSCRTSSGWRTSLPVGSLGPLELQNLLWPCRPQDIAQARALPRGLSQAWFPVLTGINRV